MKLNESGRQFKLVRQNSCSMQSYILTYCRLRSQKEGTCFFYNMQLCELFRFYFLKHTVQSFLHSFIESFTLPGLTLWHQLQFHGCYTQCMHKALRLGLRVREGRGFDFSSPVRYISCANQISEEWEEARARPSSWLMSFIVCKIFSSGHQPKGKIHCACRCRIISAFTSQHYKVATIYGLEENTEKEVLQLHTVQT